MRSSKLLLALLVFSPSFGFGQNHASTEQLNDLCDQASKTLVQNEAATFINKLIFFGITNDFICSNGSVLAQAVRHHQTATVKLLLEQIPEITPNSYARPDENEANWDTTPLALAAFYQYHDILDLLLQDARTDVNGVNLNRAEDDSFNVSPLYAAAYARNAYAVWHLVENPKTLPSIRIPLNGKSALEIAMERGHDDVVAILKPLTRN